MGMSGAYGQSDEREAIATLDDPFGDQLSGLEDRVSRLEGEIQALRKPRSSDGQ